MAETGRAGDLEINQDLPFQERQWRAQRAAWVAALVLILAALAGAFGHGGPLSQGRSSGGGLELGYARLLQHRDAAELSVRVGPEAVRGGEVRLELGRAWLERVRLEKITPEPDRVEAGPEGVLYVFNAREGPAAVRFDYRAEAIGGLRGWVGLEGGERLEFGQFVYP